MPPQRTFSTKVHCKAQIIGDHLQHITNFHHQPPPPPRILCCWMAAGLTHSWAKFWTSGPPANFGPPGLRPPPTINMHIRRPASGPPPNFGPPAFRQILDLRPSGPPAKFWASGGRRSKCPTMVWRLSLSLTLCSHLIYQSSQEEEVKNGLLVMLPTKILCALVKGTLAFLGPSMPGS